MLAITLTVGSAKNGSSRAVAGSGMASMSDSLMRLPAADRRAVEAEAVLERAFVETCRSG